MPIRVLDASVVGRIAAGEVVERPSSVVKELIENSLDAGATSITVEIKGGGIDYLRVTDNGCGIEPGQVRLAFENHATSKLQRAEQLDDIRTLGFRGEALPSIAAVSKVEMTTRAKGAPSGVKFNIEGGKGASLREAGCPEGTTIVMRELFFNVPVRRAFLKKPGYEGGLVSDAVARLLLGNPGVSMRFIRDGATQFHSFGDGKLRHAVFAVYGRETAEGMTELDAFEGGVRIHGLIGVGELAKATRAHELFFINGRSVRCPLLSRALEEVCKSRVTIGMYPMCALNLVIPPTGVDVNVHPNKLEVRFRDEDAMRAACERLLSRAFEGERVLEIGKLAAPGREVERRSEVREVTPAVQREIAKEPTKVEKEAKFDIKPTAVFENPPKQEAPFRPQMPPLPTPRGEQQALDLDVSAGPRVLREPVASSLAEPVRTVELPEDENRPKLEVVPPREGATAPRSAPWRVIGVAFKTYILIESGDALIWIDQHAAHERLQYERYMARAEAGAASQQLLAPLVLSVSARELAAVEENREALAAAGYEVEPFGEREIRVTAVPFVLGKAELRPLFLETLQNLSQLKAATLDARRAEIMQMACKSAVKGGDPLSDSEISALIGELQATGAPPTCPHGRPVAKVMTRRDLEKLFKRIQ